MRALPLVLTAFLAAPAASAQQLLMVVHRDASLSDVSRQSLSRVFLGQLRDLGGVKVTPVVLGDKSARLQLVARLSSRTPEAVEEHFVKLELRAEGRWPALSSSGTELVGRISESASANAPAIIAAVGQAQYQALSPGDRAQLTVLSIDEKAPTDPAYPFQSVIRIVVSEKSPITTLSRAQVASIFLKKAATLEDGTAVEPMDQVQGTARESFSESVLRKSAAAMKAYWTQRVFQGQGVPPAEKGSDAELMQAVSANPQAIGYVLRTAKLAGVREVTLTE